MNWTVAMAAFVASAMGVAGGFMGVWWRLERHQRREAEARIARAIIEVALVRAHLLHFPTQWHAPLKALKCAEKALETLDGRPEARGPRPEAETSRRVTIHKAATCGASEIDGKAAEHGA